MKLRTTEQLSDKLSADLAWRKIELAELKRLVENTKNSPSKHNVLIRSGVCILYAHWEGFIKLAASSYLEYVRVQKLHYEELASNFLALAMKEKLKEAKETNKPSLYIPVCEFFLDELHQRCELPKEVIFTASNLSSEILKEITRSLGIDFSPYETKSQIIDTKLLKTRNEIAHGEHTIFDKDDYVVVHEQVILMLDIFRNQIVNAAIGLAYKRSSAN